MRSLIVIIATSLDGHHTGAGGDLSVMPLDGGFSAYNVERLRGASTLLAGRTTYLDFVSHWPGVEADESQPAIEREISGLNNAIEKVVVSDTLTEADTGAWASTTRIIGRADAVYAVRALKAADVTGDIVVFGSVQMWNALAEAGLVDEVHVMVGPALLGDGPAVYTGARVALTLSEVRRLDDSQLVLLRYTTES